ncbi:MAG TPA: TetR/AcrR family transcriptional regulator [Acidimicrobiia bacterium]
MTTKEKRGRPRKASIDTAILDAAATLLSQRGYRGMTVAAVAAAAGVTEPTVYLRHPTKHDLAVAAIPRLPMLNHPPDTGDTKTDLTLLLTDLVATGRAIGLAMTGVVLAEEAEHPELLDHWRATVGAAAVGAVHDIIKHGQRRGEVRRDVRTPVVADLILGAYFGRYTHQGQPDRAWIRDVINIVWPGVAAR